MFSRSYFKSFTKPFTSQEKDWECSDTNPNSPPFIGTASTQPFALDHSPFHNLSRQRQNYPNFTEHQSTSCDLLPKKRNGEHLPHPPTKFLKSDSVRGDYRQSLDPRKKERILVESTTSEDGGFDLMKLVPNTSRHSKHTSTRSELTDDDCDLTLLESKPLNFGQGKRSRFDRSTNRTSRILTTLSHAARQSSQSPAPFSDSFPLLDKNFRSYDYTADHQRQRDSRVYQKSYENEIVRPPLPSPVEDVDQEEEGYLEAHMEIARSRNSKNADGDEEYGDGGLFLPSDDSTLSFKSTGTGYLSCMSQIHNDDSYHVEEKEQTLNSHFVPLVAEQSRGSNSALRLKDASDCTLETGNLDVTTPLPSFTGDIAACESLERLNMAESLIGKAGDTILISTAPTSVQVDTGKDLECSKNGDRPLDAIADSQHFSEHNSPVGFIQAQQTHNDGYVQDEAAAEHTLRTKLTEHVHAHDLDKRNDAKAHNNTAAMAIGQSNIPAQVLAVNITTGNFEKSSLTQPRAETISAQRSERPRTRDQAIALEMERQLSELDIDYITLERGKQEKLPRNENNKPETNMLHFTDESQAFDHSQKQDGRLAGAEQDSSKSIELPHLHTSPLSMVPVQMSQVESIDLTGDSRGSSVSGGPNPENTGLTWNRNSASDHLGTNSMHDQQKETHDTSTKPKKHNFESMVDFLRKQMSAGVSSAKEKEAKEAKKRSRDAPIDPSKITAKDELLIRLRQKKMLWKETHWMYEAITQESISADALRKKYKKLKATQDLFGLVYPENVDPIAEYDRSRKQANNALHGNLPSNPEKSSFHQYQRGISSRTDVRKTLLPNNDEMFERGSNRNSSSEERNVLTRENATESGEPSRFVEELRLYSGPEQDISPCVDGRVESFKRPVTAGKTVNATYLESVMRGASEVPSCDDSSQVDTSEVFEFEDEQQLEEEHRCHFVYFIRRRAWLYSEDEENVSWVTVGEQYLNIKRANVAAAAEFRHIRHEAAIWPLTSWSWNGDDACGMSTYTGYSRTGRVCVVVDRYLQDFNSGEVPDCSEGFLSKEVYDIMTKETSYEIGYSPTYSDLLGVDHHLKQNQNPALDTVSEHLVSSASSTPILNAPISSTQSTDMQKSNTLELQDSQSDDEFADLFDEVYAELKDKQEKLQMSENIDMQSVGENTERALSREPQIATVGAIGDNSKGKLHETNDAMIEVTSETDNANVNTADTGFEHVTESECDNTPGVETAEIPRTITEPGPVIESSTNHPIDMTSRISTANEFSNDSIQNFDNAATDCERYADSPDAKYINHTDISLEPTIGTTIESTEKDGPSNGQALVLDDTARMLADTIAILTVAREDDALSSRNFKDSCAHKHCTPSEIDDHGLDSSPVPNRGDNMNDSITFNQISLQPAVVDATKEVACSQEANSAIHTSIEHQHVEEDVEMANAILPERVAEKTFDVSENETQNMITSDSQLLSDPKIMQSQQSPQTSLAHNPRCDDAARVAGDDSKWVPGWLRSAISGSQKSDQDAGPRIHTRLLSSCIGIGIADTDPGNVCLKDDESSSSSTTISFDTCGAISDMAISQPNLGGTGNELPDDPDCNQSLSRNADHADHAGEPGLLPYPYDGVTVEPDNNRSHMMSSDELKDASNAIIISDGTEEGEKDTATSPEAPDIAERVTPQKIVKSEYLRPSGSVYAVREQANKAAAAKVLEMWEASIPEKRKRRVDTIMERNKLKKIMAERLERLEEDEGLFADTFEDEDHCKTFQVYVVKRELEVPRNL